MSRLGSLKERLKETTPKSHVGNQCEADDNQDAKDPLCDFRSRFGNGKLINCGGQYDLASRNMFLIITQNVNLAHYQNLTDANVKFKFFENYFGATTDHSKIVEVTP